MDIRFPTSEQLDGEPERHRVGNQEIDVGALVVVRCECDARFIDIDTDHLSKDRSVDLSEKPCRASDVQQRHLRWIPLMRGQVFRQDRQRLHCLTGALLVVKHLLGMHEREAVLVDVACYGN